MKRGKQLRDAEVEVDVNATVDYLADHPSVDAKRLGIIGFCMGRRVAYLMAELNPQVRAVEAYYGGNIMVPWGDGPSPYELSERLHCPLLFHFGADDTNSAPTDREKLDQELTGLGKDHELHTQTGADHASMNSNNIEVFWKLAECK